MPSSGPSASVHLLPFAQPLTGPLATASWSVTGSEGSQTVTGGGLVGVVHREDGLKGLWRGAARVAGSLTVRLASADFPLVGTALRVGPGGWERRIPVPGGRILVERGVLPDSAPVPLLHWSWEGSSPEDDPAVLELALAPPPEEASRKDFGGLEGPLGPDGLGVLLLPPGEAWDSLRRRIHPPHARELARHRRGGAEPGGADATGSGSAAGPSTGSHPGGLRLVADGRSLDRAGLILAGAALGTHDDGRPAAPFLLGLEAGAPVLASGSALAELGLGAFCGGRAELGWAMLEALADENAPPPLPLLHLAGEAAAWTGALSRLVRLRPALDAAMDHLLEVARAGDSTPPPAAHPGPLAVLERLARGVERGGGGWREAILEARQAVARSLHTGSPAGSRASGSVRLPVLGGSPSNVPAPEADRPAHLPPPRAFAPLDAPVTAPRRTLHAARLLRSWIEGRLGADPDARYGRLALNLELREGPETLEVDQLQVGDARVGLSCRLTDGACRFHLLQAGGRVPLNLVFRARVPLSPPLKVRLAQEVVELPVEPLEGGSGVSLQFPLDPERRIVIERSVEEAG
jgi:hypothetical protein